ncbi:MAG: nucleoside triphosphate pyrophosphatase [Actinomycetes bacterium]
MTYHPLRKVVLASASPSRHSLLTSAGIHPSIIVSGVDEEEPAITALSPAEMVVALAILKAHTVRKLVDHESLVIGADSTFEFEGKSLGKPETRERAIERSKLLSGNAGLLHTGHCIIDTKQGIEISDISTSKVYFAKMTDLEIEAYADSGEPLQVAGGFTLDGLSSPFIERVEGDPTGIIGLSLPLLRRAVTALGLEWTDIAEMAVHK